MESDSTLASSGVDPHDPGHGTLVSEPGERGTPRAALVDALFAEDVERCRGILDAHPGLVNARLRHQACTRVHYWDSAWGATYQGGYQGLTPVLFASLAPRFREESIDLRALSPSDLAILVLVVERGAALESTPGADEWTSYILIEVCRDYDSPEAIGLLVRIGADLHTRKLDQDNRTLLQVAAGRGSVGAVAFLLDRGVPMNYLEEPEGGPVNGTPLQTAAENGRQQVVRLLLSRGALSDIESLDNDGRTPLLCAASGSSGEDANACPSHHPGREETIRLLVVAGADLTAWDRRDLRWDDPGDWSHLLSDTPLGYVSTWGSADIGGDKVTPLHLAAQSWNAAGVQALLDLGADPGATDEHGRQPLHWAALGRDLLWYNTSGQRRISPTWSALLADPRSSAYSATLVAMESTVSQLVVYNADLSRPDAFGLTPLHYAASMKLVGLVTLLIRQGVDIGLADNEGRTVLHHLADPIHHPRKDEPADSNLEDENLSAALAGRVKGHDVNHVDNNGSAALHVAARSVSDAAVAFLLGLGADPNLPDREGSTPLHLAARRAEWVYSELLVGAGADASVRDGQGRTAADIEEATSRELRQGLASYLEYLARPVPPQGLGRGRGRWQRGPPTALGDSGGHLSSGAGHGRGDR
ncbi:ankyrin repeat-containing domain protein [Coniochaeta sp. 2T2.1]|nr:ankyrin repeat-containing domain protein [Coniochaeta sp. 2T2.1]